MNLKHYVSVLFLAVIASIAIVPQFTFAQDQNELEDRCVVDIVLMGDQSDSITYSSVLFEQERDFILGVLNNLPIAVGETNAAVGFFDSSASVVFPLTSDKATLITNVTNYVQGGGLTDIGEAIRKAQEELDANARPSVQNVIVILTDGMPYDYPNPPEDEVAAANAARAKGSLVYAVGIGNSVTLATLASFANTPTEDFVFQAQFNELPDFIESLRDSVCEVVGQIEGTIFVDVNQNGVQDTGEIGASNVPVNLYLANDAGPGATPAQSTTTDANGNYAFDVSGGSYILEVPSSAQALMPVIDFDQTDQRTEEIEIATSQIISDVDGAVKPQLVCSFQSPAVDVGETLPAATFELQSPSGVTVPVSGVEISVALNPATAGLSGTNLVQTVNGVATFDDLSVDSDGTYNLVASVGAPLNLVADCTSFDVNEVEIPNEAPIAVDDTYVTYEDTPLVVTDPKLLANDSDPDGDAIYISSLDSTSAEGGIISDTSLDGDFTYTPPAGFIGIDTFTYQISDGDLLSEIATVTVDVMPMIDIVDGTATVTPPICEITGMELWNADTDSLIGPLPNGATINLEVIGDPRLTIVAVTNPSTVGSVSMTLIGARAYADYENYEPYSIYGDDRFGDMLGEHLPAGLYTIMASAYTEAYTDGELCDEYTVNFDVVDPRQPQATEEPQSTQEPGSTQEPQSTEEPSNGSTGGSQPSGEPDVSVEITGFLLINADTDTIIGALSNGASIDTDAIGTRNLNIVAETSGAGSVIFSGSFPRNENSAPFSAGGDNAGDYLPISMKNGSYSVSAYAYSEAYGNGIASAPASVNFTVTGTE